MDANRLYVSNWPYDTTEEQVREFFTNYRIVHVKMITDRDTGRFRGFCFVELESAGAAAEAIAALNGQEYGGRTIKVAKAEPQPAQRTGRGSGGNGQRQERGRNYGSRRG